MSDKPRSHEAGVHPFNHVHEILEIATGRQGEGWKLKDLAREAAKRIKRQQESIAALSEEVARLQSTPVPPVTTALAGLVAAADRVAASHSYCHFCNRGGASGGRSIEHRPNRPRLAAEAALIAQDVLVAPPLRMRLTPSVDMEHAIGWTGNPRSVICNEDGVSDPPPEPCGDLAFDIEQDQVNLAARRNGPPRSKPSPESWFYEIPGEHGSRGLKVAVEPDGKTFLQPVDPAVGNGFALYPESARALRVVLSVFLGEGVDERLTEFMLLLAQDRERNLMARYETRGQDGHTDFEREALLAEATASARGKFEAWRLRDQIKRAARVHDSLANVAKLRLEQLESKRQENLALRIRLGAIAQLAGKPA